MADHRAPASETTERIRHYNQLADGEWNRLQRDLPGRVSLEVHRRFLARFGQPGWRVLETGAVRPVHLELARLGTRILVTDLSPV